MYKRDLSGGYLQVYQWMKAELLPRFIESPAWQAVKSRCTPKKSQVAKVLLPAADGKLGMVEGASNRVFPMLGANPGIQRQWSIDSDAPPSARQSAVEDVMAGESAHLLIPFNHLHASRIALVLH